MDARLSAEALFFKKVKRLKKNPKVETNVFYLGKQRGGLCLLRATRRQSGEGGQVPQGCSHVVKPGARS